VALSDKSLTCVECGSQFPFTVGEQEFFASRGFTNEPKRCSQCRAARKSQQGGNGDSYGSPARCIQRSAPSVARTRWFPSDPGVTNRCTVVIASVE